MFISLLAKIAYGFRKYSGSPECFGNIFYPAYGDSGQIHLNQSLLHREFPTTVTFNGGNLKRYTFELEDIEFHLPCCDLKVPFIMLGTIALTVAVLLIFAHIDQFISFFFEQSVEGFFHSGAGYPHIE